MDKTINQPSSLLSFDDIEDIHSLDIKERADSVDQQTSVKGISFAILSNCIWSVGPLSLGLLYRYSNITVYEIVYWKSLFMNIANLILAFYCGVSVIDLPRDCRVLAILRAFFGGVALCCTFASIQYISISKANILYFTAPLYIPFLARYFLNEPISHIDIIALACGFAGIIIMNKTEESQDPAQISNEIFGSCLSLIGGVASSIAWI